MTIWMRSRGIEPLPYPVHSEKDGWTIYKLREGTADEFDVLAVARKALGIEERVNTPEEAARVRAILQASKLKCSSATCATLVQCKAAHSCLQRRQQ